MKKLLIIGRINNVLEDLYHYFDDRMSSELQVQVCPLQRETVKGVMRITQPNIVIVNINGTEADNGLVMSDIYNNFPLTWVICLGSQKEFQPFKGYFEIIQFSPIERPCDNSMILAKVREILEIPITNEYDALRQKRVADTQEDKAEHVHYETTEGDRKTYRKHFVLLVDNDEKYVRSLKEKLSEIHQVMMATSASQCMTLLGFKKPEIVLLNNDIKDVNGRDLIEAVLEFPDCMNIPVILITKPGENMEKAEYNKIGAEGFITRTASIDKIYDIIDNTLSGI